jgi:hypothetical protein
MKMDKMDSRTSAQQTCFGKRERAGCMSRLLAGISRVVHCTGISWTWRLELIASVGSQSADATKFNSRKNPAGLLGDLSE